MSEKRDYYEVLGLDRGASEADVRKAYKRLALEFHPDRNDGCTESAEKFKEVTEAYAVLSDGEKRRRYDQYGHAGVDGAAGVDFGADIFSHVHDLFADFFGGGAAGGPFGGGARTRNGPMRGRDLRIRQELTLEEAVAGCKKEIHLNTPIECSVCSGSGSEPGTSPERCHTCDGRGQVSTGRGFILFTQTCPACQGQGTVVTTPCHHCEGAGWEEKQRAVTVSFPPGIDQGHRLRVVGQGLPGKNGGSAGNLYVDVLLAQHERFERDGDDLITRAHISFPEAALGTSVKIPMLDGTTFDLELSPGIQPGGVITVPGKGAPNVNGRGGAGALHVVVQVTVPEKLSKRARKLLEELQGELETEDEVSAKTA